MKTFNAFIKKEFYHIWRDKQTLFILLAMPVVQIVIFGFTLSNEVKNAKIAILNPSKDVMSATLTERISASQYFDLRQNLKNTTELENAFKQGKIKMAVVFPEKFTEDLLHTNKAQIQIIADASDPNTATTLINYASSIIGQYQQELQGSKKIPYTITTETRMLYNPQLKGAYNFVPGVMAMILMLVCSVMTSIAIVREKEKGTMEVLLVSPSKPLMVIIAKAIPYLGLSLINVASILLLSVYVLNLTIQGSLLLLVLESVLFTITCLSLGLLVSSVTNSQQVAMMVSLLGMFLPTLMFSGFMFPVENMPAPLQWFSNLVPSKWYYIVVKSVMIKGQGITSVWKETLILAGMTLFFLVVSLKSYKIRLA